MTEKWLSLTPNPPRTPDSYTLTKIHKPTLIGRPIIQGCEGPTGCISSFVDRLVQPIAQSQDSYYKDTTDFINFVEKTKVPADVILVSTEVTSLYKHTTRRGDKHGTPSIPRTCTKEHVQRAEARRANTLQAYGNF